MRTLLIALACLATVAVTTTRAAALGCTLPSCDGKDPSCIALPVQLPDGFPCTDRFVGGLCAVSPVGTCKDGECQVPLKDCAAIDQCHDAGVCDPGTGACSQPRKANGTACDDGDACSAGESCQAGVCGASAPAADGTRCDDSDPCTRDDRCDGGTCTARPVTCGPTGPHPLGGELAVNTTTPGFQYDPAICRGANGDAVVVWSDVTLDPRTGQPASGRIVGRRFTRAGAALGGELAISAPGVIAINPDVACAANGDFAVAWTQLFAKDGLSDTNIVARRYAADATPKGDPFVVNTDFAGRQGGILNGLAIASDAAGGLIVVWHTPDQDFGGAPVSARRFAADGAPLGDQFEVNDAMRRSQGLPDVAAYADGSFVVAWTGEDVDTEDIKVRRYASDGAPLGAEFRANATTMGQQGFGIAYGEQGPAVAALDDGGFVAAWTSFVPDATDGTGAPVIRVQRFAADGQAVGAEHILTAPPKVYVAMPDVAGLGAGSFAVAVSSFDFNMFSVDTSSVYVQRFGADSLRSGPAVPVAAGVADRLEGAVVLTSADGAKIGLTGGGAAIAGAANGEFSVAYESAGRPDPSEVFHGRDGDGAGVFARGYVPADQCRQAETCDPATGMCAPPKADGSVCDDGDACTRDDVCIAASCGGRPSTCLADQCQEDGGTCDPATGVCAFPPKPDGTVCRDLDRCTPADTCAAGVCVGGAPLQCPGPPGACEEAPAC
ncbi:MAG: hypothetical protein ACRERC_21175, partial [Candidatus Binatia bacterium]